MEAKDYSSDRQIKYCAGCGDYSILAAMKKTFADLSLEKKDVAVISGIGCSSRTPYYLSTWGFNTIHGRGGAIASGLKIVQPNMSVWQCTGDGDCTAIGGNHFIHEVRRNLDINVLVFNNKIYGLTKGQYSPTTPQGQVTKTSPYGTIESPINIGRLCLASNGTFFARCLDKNLKDNVEMFKKAYEHKGTSIVECLTNCVVWNDGIHKNKLYFNVEDGEELTFEKDDQKYSIILDFNLGKSRIVSYNEEAPTIYNIKNRAMVDMLIRDFSGDNNNPVALGVLYRDDSISTYEEEIYKQMKEDL